MDLGPSRGCMVDYILTLFEIPDTSLLIYGQYSLWLVILSALVAIFASYLGLHIASQAMHLTSRRYRQLAVATGSVALGGGIWSMHFIGMLAFELCTTVTYEWRLTALSMIPGILASWVAIFWIMERRFHWAQLLVGGVLVGAGIGTMHYSGMAAMTMAPDLRYDLPMFGLSIVVAVSLAVLALWIRFGLERLVRREMSANKLNLLAGTVMGFAISGMHYTGMAAARFVRPEGLELSKQTSEISTTLAFGILLATLCISALSFSVNMMLKYREASTRAQEGETRIRSMMDTAVDGIVTIDQDGVILSVNQTVEQLLGWTAGELVGQNVRVLTPEPHRSNHDGYLERYIKTKEARIIGTGREVEALHKDGSHIAVRLAIGATKLGGKYYFVAFITDIRQRLEIQQAMHESEEKYRSLISNIPGIAYRCQQKPGWPMIFISEAVEQMTGYPAKAFCENADGSHLNFQDLIYEDDLSSVQVDHESGETFVHEYRLRTKDNQIKWVLEQGCSVLDESTGEIFLDGFIMDITERKSLEHDLESARERAEAAAEARAAFLANMSHEIRTPMNAVIGFSDLLLETEMSDEQRDHLKTINSSSKSLLHLLNDILDSAKLDKGKMELELRPFSLVQEIDEVVSSCHLQAKIKGIALEMSLSSDLAPVYVGAADRIRQVLTNIIGNAIKFTEEGRVDVIVAPVESGEKVCIEVVDTGIGMDEGQLQRIFDAFTQADASVNRRFGGTGLGTTISKKLIDLMGGDISVSSKIGEGSRFEIVLPLEISHEPLEDVGQINIELPPLSVLVVDDVQQNIDLIQVLLEKRGHTVVSADNGKLALEKMEQEKLDLVLMDVQMPTMDGLSAAYERRAREERKGLPYIPIIALTANAMMQNKAEAYEAGMNGFATKPINIESLLREIARVLSFDVAPLRAGAADDEPLAAGSSNLARGIKLWGSETLYRQQVVRYLKQVPQTLSELKENLAQKNWGYLKGEGHRGKGVSANLALVQLQQAFAELENVSSSADEVAVQAAVSRIEELYCQILAEFSVPVDAETGSPSPPEEKTVEELVLLLERLLETVNHNELSDDLLEELMLAEAGECRDQLRMIYNACSDFEFEKAGGLISSLLETLREL